MISEKLKHKNDIKKYGYYQSGVYKGISWVMERVEDKHWCGYVNYNEIDDILQEKIDKVIYMGPSFMSTGFDCAHYNDYPNNKNGTYKDYNFVLKIIIDIIDVITE